MSSSCSSLPRPISLCLYTAQTSLHSVSVLSHCETLCHFSICLETWRGYPTRERRPQTFLLYQLKRGDERNMAIRYMWLSFIWKTRRISVVHPFIWLIFYCFQFTPLSVICFWYTNMNIVLLADCRILQKYNFCCFTHKELAINLPRVSINT